MRVRRLLRVDAGAAVEPPRTASERLVVRAGGHGPLDALVTRPEGTPAGVVFSFVGYDTPIGPWEEARAGLVAQASGATVVTCELPGMSRHRSRLDAAVRAAARRGDAGPWGDLHAAYLLEAARSAGVGPGPVSIVGFSTGCSLAVVTAPALAAAHGPLGSLVLVEPVGIAPRSLVRLAADNLADAARWPDVTRRNRPHAWVVATRRAGRGDHVSISPHDLLAATGVLRRPGISPQVAAAVAADGPVHLVRGERSDLCPAAPFAQLDQVLADVGVPGTTLLVAGAGHQLWHAAGVVAAVADALLSPRPAEGR